MRAHRLNVTISKDHRLSMDLPVDFPAGPAEVIVLSETMERRPIIRLGGVLGPGRELPEGDPIAEALMELRETRSFRHRAWSR